MDRSEVVSSAASGSVGFTRTQNTDEYNNTMLSGEEEEEEGTLDLVEDAILRTLKRYSSKQQHLYHDQENARPTRGRRLDDEDDDEECSSPSVNAPPARSSNPADGMEVLSHLLQQVHELRRNERRQSSQRPKESPISKATVQPTRSFDRRRSKRGGEDSKRGGTTSSEELRMALEAASVAAKAAADAAEAAALSVARNTEAINIMVKQIQSSKKQRRANKTRAAEERKAVLKSNHVTHWILGFMAVTTVAWRFGVVRVVKGVSSKLRDPVSFVGSLVGGGNEEQEKEKAVSEKHVEKQGGNLLDKLPHVDLPLPLPSIIPNDGAEKKEKKESVATAVKETKGAAGKEVMGFLGKSAGAVEGKRKEVSKEVGFSFGSLFKAKEKQAPPDSSASS